MDKAVIADLRERVGKETEPDRALDDRIHEVFVERVGWNVPDYTSSIDAALALVERVLPGWYCGLQPWFYIDGERITFRSYVLRPRWDEWTPHGAEWFDRAEAEAATAPLAILTALLQALSEGGPHAG